jgi:rubrerythrin
MSPVSDPRARLIHVLRSACSGELAAVHAYRGHWKSLPATAPERERVRVIEAEERHHRELVLGLLAELGSGPSRAREAVFWLIGNTISILCRIGGWFVPMYGAGKLESSNIKEYEDAARYAQAAGLTDMIDCLLTMAEVEWEHEKYFREQIVGHWMLRFFRPWITPPAKETIRAAYALEVGVKIQDDQSAAETDQQRSAECAL